MDTAGEKGVWDELGDWDGHIHTAKITEENLLFCTGNTIVPIHIPLAFF